MKNRYIHWRRALLVIYGIFLLSLPLAIGYIPIYHWLGLKPPDNLGLHWLYGFLYCLVWTIGILVLLFIVGIFVSIKNLFNFLFPRDSSKEE